MWASAEMVMMNTKGLALLSPSHKLWRGVCTVGVVEALCVKVLKETMKQTKKQRNSSTIKRPCFELAQSPDLVTVWNFLAYNNDILSLMFLFRNNGAVVTMSSGSCTLPMPQMTVYAATKVE